VIPIGIHMAFFAGFGVGWGNTGPSSVGSTFHTTTPPESNAIVSVGGVPKATLLADNREDVDDAGEPGAFGEGRARGSRLASTGLVIDLAKSCGLHW